MLPNATQLHPVHQSDRINSIDAIRGIAVLGILLMNIVGFGLPYSYSDPTISGGADGWNLKAWFAEEMFFEGTFRGLFTMLFGSGFILLTSRMEAKGVGIVVADVYYRRTLWLLLFGVIHCYFLLWHGEVLYVYGLFGLMLFPFRNSKPWHLAGAGVALLLIGTLMNVMAYTEIKEIRNSGIEAQNIKAAGDTLTKDQKANIIAWEEELEKQSPEKIQKTIDNMHKGYWGVFVAKLPVNQYMQTTLVYELWVWDVLSFMLIGMALFKWGIFQNLRTKRFYFLMMITGYVVGLSINYYEAMTEIRSGFDPVAISQGEITYQIGRTFTTLGHIGLFMLFIGSGWLSALRNALAAVGKMALTNYLLTSIICAFVFLGFGFGLYGQLQRYQLYYVVAGIWIFQLIISPIWMKYFHYGPAEWLWRSLTYKKRQPFIREEKA
jgi:uncharacterized protein